jgi:hypothetical protein
MKMRLFVGGILVGIGIGINVGGMLIDVSAGEFGQSRYPQGLALLLALVGGVSAGSAFRSSLNTSSLRP